MICEICHGAGYYWNELLGEKRLCPDCNGEVDAPQTFECPTCGAVSYNPNDIRERYCGRCHAWQS
jgi:ribosomal protein S27AE